MKKLTAFFRQLNGDHIKKDKVDPCKRQSFPHAIDIDCCDVEDTCCDQYE